MPTNGNFITSYAPETIGHEAVPPPQQKADAFADHDAIAKHGLVMRKPQDLTPYGKNPRHNEGAVDAVAASIKQFGFKVPLVIDSQGVVVCGHTRLKAALKLGLAEVPCVVADDLTPEQIKAFRLADNKTAELAEWDMDLLNEEMAGIADIDMEAFGFDMAEFEPPAEEVVEDEGEPENVATVVQPGQVWQLGEHRLICGDSTKPETIARLMAGEQADLWLTDPPYNVAYVGKTADALTIKNDSMDDAKFRAFLIDAFTAAMTHIKPGGAFYIWHADSEGFNFRTACREASLQIRQCLVWVKNTLVLGRQDYQWKHEPCLYGWKDGGPHYFTSSRKQETVIEEDRPDVAHMSKADLQALCKQLLASRDQVETSVLYEDKPAKSEDHPTMKPVKLFARQIANSSKPGEIVLDTFGGSGTTIMAAEQLKRKARLVELDPHYCDVIIARWEAFTGKTAQLLENTL